MARKVLPLAMIIGGVTLMAISYFFLTAPWGQPNPRLQFAPLLLVIGVVTAFLSAVVYELLPDREE